MHTKSKIGFAKTFAVFLFWVFPFAAHSQVSPGVVEPEIVTPLPQTLDQNEGLIVDDTRSEDDEDALSVSERRFPLEAIGLDYSPNDHGLPENVIAMLESTARDFAESVNGESTFNELQTFSQKLMSQLRQQGYVLAQVYIPPQKIDDGSVIVRVMPALLAGTSAKNSTLYRSNTLERKFDTLRDEPVNQMDVERRLLRINDLPGLDANGSFSAAEKTAYTNFRVNVLEEDPLEFRARIDNHNPESTGDLRFIAGASLNNPLGIRDQLDANFIQTFDKGDLTNVRVRYQAYTPDLVHLLGARYSQSDYSTESASFLVDGDTYIGDVFWRAGWIRSLDFNFSTETALAVKRADQRLPASPESTDRLTVGSFALILDDVDRRFSGFQALTAVYYRGLNNTLGSLDSSVAPSPTISGLDGAFEKWYASYQRLQSVTRNQSLYLRLSGQFADERLHSLEKMNIGGPYSVRSHEIGFASGDRAKFASLAWRANAGLFTDSMAFQGYDWADVLSLEIFVDYAKSSAVNTSSNDAEIAGAGATLQFEFPADDVSLQLTWATPFDDTEVLDGVTRSVSDQRLWFSVSAEF